MLLPPRAAPDSPGLLKQYHTTHLRLTGTGKPQWEVTKIGTDEEKLGLESEIRAIEEGLRDVDGWKKVCHLSDELSKSRNTH